MASLVHVNIRGLRANRSLLTQYLVETNPDFLLLNETKLNEDKANIKFPGYNLVVNKPAINTAGGTAIYAKTGLSASPLDSTSINNDCCAALVNFPTTGPTALVSIYINANTLYIDNTNISAFISKFKQCIFMGDFNAYHPCISENSTTANTVGRNIYKLIDQHNLNIINKDGAPTRYNSASGNSTLLDLAIITNNISHHIISYHNGEDVGSDHLPLHLVLDQPFAHLAPTLRRNLNKADWDKFASHTYASFSLLADPITHPPSTIEEVDDLVQTTSENLINALDQVAPLKPCTFRPFTLPEDILQIIKDKRKMRRKLLRTPHSVVLRNAYNQLTKQVSKAVRAEKDKQWKEACSNLQYTEGAKFWNKFKSLSGINSKFDKPHRVKTPAGELTTDDLSTADTLADHLSRCHTPNVGPQFNEELFNNINNAVNDKSELFLPKLEITPEQGDDQ